MDGEAVVMRVKTTDGAGADEPVTEFLSRFDRGEVSEVE
jgi:hypothetical protein